MSKNPDIDTAGQEIQPQTYSQEHPNDSASHSAMHLVEQSIPVRSPTTAPVMDLSQLTFGEIMPLQQVAQNCKNDDVLSKKEQELEKKEDHSGAKFINPEEEIDMQDDDAALEGTFQGQDNKDLFTDPILQNSLNLGEKIYDSEYKDVKKVPSNLENSNDLRKQPEGEYKAQEPIEPVTPPMHQPQLEDPKIGEILSKNDQPSSKISGQILNLKNILDGEEEILGVAQPPHASSKASNPGHKIRFQLDELPAVTEQRTGMRTRFNGTKNVVGEDSDQKYGKKNRKSIESIATKNEGTIALQINRSSTQLNKARQAALKEDVEDAQIDEGTPEPISKKLSIISSKLEGASKIKKSCQNHYADCLKIYKKMFLFDWDLKDIVSTRHSPKDELSSGAFWFYINTTYFSDEMQFNIVGQTFEDWLHPIKHSLNNKFQSYTNFINSQQNQQDSYKLHDEPSDIKLKEQINQQQEQQVILDKQQSNDNEPITPVNQQQVMLAQDYSNEIVAAHVDKLLGKRKKFIRFKKHFQGLKYRVSQHQFDENEINTIHDEARTIPRTPFGTGDSPIKRNEATENNDAEQEIAEIKQTIQLQDFQKLLTLAEKDLSSIQERNQDTLRSMYDRVRNKYLEAIEMPKEHPEFKDNRLYIAEQMYKYGPEFLAHVDPNFVQDMINNREWYSQNISRFMININYPSKLQNDFLKELELSQQRRNDMRYRRIMDQMDKIEEAKGSINSHAQRVKLQQEIENSLKQRAQIAQDDACCAICGIGDYEDDDKIVFCVNCSIPVHQSCFGLEQIPDFDWICYNCFTFGFQRGLMVKCLLCPKRGGAMKPTNIFCTFEKYYEFKRKALGKKSDKNKKEKFNNLLLPQIKACTGPPTDQQHELHQMMQRLETNCSLTELLTRERNYKGKIQEEYQAECDNIQKIKECGQMAVELSEKNEAFKYQEELALNFNEHEKKNHLIPEDYSHFVRRNEPILEAKETPETDSLYKWVHHSCAMWMPGPVVTPRTPVQKLNKIDFSKFNAGCVICGKKGIDVGAVIKCYKSECQIQFHVECAKRDNYCMEIEKKAGTSNKEKIYKIFCESHRPFKIIQEINEYNLKEVEDIQKFAKTIEKCIDIQMKHLQKPKKHISKTERNKMLRIAIQNKKQELIQKKRETKLLAKPKKEKKEKKVKNKKWKEKDKRILLEGVKDKYLLIKKMRMNLIKVDPMINENKKFNKELKRIKKQQDKKNKQKFERMKKEFEEKLLQEREAVSKEKGLRNRAQRLAATESNQEPGNPDTAEPKQNEVMEGGPQLNDLPISDCSGQEMEENEITQQVDGGEGEQEFQIPELKIIPEFYKFANPPTIQELEWIVTKSTLDFPWKQIQFEPYKAKECYKMYTQVVLNVDDFLKKVLGPKPKYQKMIQNQLDGKPTIDYLINYGFTQNQVPNTAASLGDNGLFTQLNTPGANNVNLNTSLSSLKQIDLKNETNHDGQDSKEIKPNLYSPVKLTNAALFCMCKGQNISEIMVECETGEEKCPNGGWVHPQCSKQLRNLTEVEINQIDKFFCEDCLAVKGSNIFESVKKVEADHKPPDIFKSYKTSPHKHEQLKKKETKKLKTTAPSKKMMIIQINQQPIQNDISQDKQPCIDQNQEEHQTLDKDISKQMRMESVASFTQNQQNQHQLQDFSNHQKQYGSDNNLKQEVGSNCHSKKQLKQKKQDDDSNVHSQNDEQMNQLLIDFIQKHVEQSETQQIQSHSSNTNNQQHHQQSRQSNQQQNSLFDTPSPFKPVNQQGSRPQTQIQYQQHVQTQQEQNYHQEKEQIHPQLQEQLRQLCSEQTQGGQPSQHQTLQNQMNQQREQQRPQQQQSVNENQQEISKDTAYAIEQLILTLMKQQTKQQPQQQQVQQPEPRQSQQAFNMADLQQSNHQQQSHQVQHKSSKHKGSTSSNQNKHQTTMNMSGNKSRDQIQSYGSQHNQRGDQQFQDWGQSLQNTLLAQQQQQQIQQQQNQIQELLMATQSQQSQRNQNQQQNQQVISNIIPRNQPGDQDDDNVQNPPWTEEDIHLILSQLNTQN